MARFHGREEGWVCSHRVGVVWRQGGLGAWEREGEGLRMLPLRRSLVLASIEYDRGRVYRDTPNWR
jgi:hypothetical protein